jgi:predicted transcriptional regulator
MEKDFENSDFSEKATLASITKRVNAMKILLFLSKDEDNDEAYYLQIISNALDMNEATAFTNLNNLVQAGLVEKGESKANRKNRYYAIGNKRLAEKAIEKYKRSVGFQLARLIPYERRYCSQLKNDRRFQKACEDYGLTISEGIQEILSCHKIGKESVGTDTVIWRREQGYDEPEKGKSLTEVEEVE